MFLKTFQDLSPVIWSDFEFKEKMKSYSSPLQKKGLWAERQVYKLFIKEGYHCYGHRVKLFSVEVDLVFLSPKGQWQVLEVKSYDVNVFTLSWSQKKRLTKVLKSGLDSNFVRVHLIYFSEKKMRCIEDILVC